MGWIGKIFKAILMIIAIILIVIAIMYITMYLMAAAASAWASVVAWASALTWAGALAALVSLAWGLFAIAVVLGTFGVWNRDKPDEDDEPSPALTRPSDAPGTVDWVTGSTQIGVYGMLLLLSTSMLARRAKGESVEDF